MTPDAPATQLMTPPKELAATQQVWRWLMLTDEGTHTTKDLETVPTEEAFATAATVPSSLPSQKTALHRCDSQQLLRYDDLLQGGVVGAVESMFPKTMDVLTWYLAQQAAEANSNTASSIGSLPKCLHAYRRKYPNTSPLFGPMFAQLPDYLATPDAQQWLKVTPKQGQLLASVAAYEWHWLLVKQSPAHPVPDNYLNQVPCVSDWHHWEPLWNNLALFTLPTAVSHLFQTAVGEGDTESEALEMALRGTEDSLPETLVMFRDVATHTSRVQQINPALTALLRLAQQSQQHPISVYQLAEGLYAQLSPLPMPLDDFTQQCAGIFNQLHADGVLLGFRSHSLSLG